MSEPAPVEEAAPPRFRLYSAGQIAAASLFGTALCGALMLSVNERRLGRRGSALALVVLGLAVEAGLIAVALMSAVPRIGGVHIILTIALRNAARRRERRDFEAHLAAGGRRHTNWRVFANVAINIALFVVACGLGGLFAHVLSDKVEVDSHLVHYRAPITAEQARGVGEVLRVQGWFAENGEAQHGWLDEYEDAQVSADGDRIAVAVVAAHSWLDDQDALAYLHELGEVISAEVFDSRPVEMRICDYEFDEVKKTLPPGPRRSAVRFGDNRIYVLRGAGEEDARKLEKPLRDSGYFVDDSPAAARLEREDDGFTLALSLEEGSWKDPKVASQLIELKSAARLALGKPVRLDLCGPHWTVRARVK